jgi:hypothetical protein
LVATPKRDGVEKIRDLVAAGAPREDKDRPHLD